MRLRGFVSAVRIGVIRTLNLQVSKKEVNKRVLLEENQPRAYDQDGAELDDDEFQHWKQRLQGPRKVL